MNIGKRRMGREYWEGLEGRWKGRREYWEGREGLGRKGLWEEWKRIV
jgi:hypothetical protein